MRRGWCAKQSFTLTPPPFLTAGAVASVGNGAVALQPPNSFLLGLQLGRAADGEVADTQAAAIAKSLHQAETQRRAAHPSAELIRRLYPLWLDTR